MGTSRLTRKLESQGIRPISNSTVLNTYEVVHMCKFHTKGVNNRDNARWKRAQFILVEGCPITSVKGCLDGFYEFAETCQYIVFEDLNIAYNGRRENVAIESILTNI